MPCSFLRFLPVLVGACCERKGEGDSSRFSVTKRLSNMFVLAALLLAQCLAHGLRMQLGGFLRINKLSETGSKFIKISSETNLPSGLQNSARWRARGRGRTWEMPGLLGRRFGTIYWIIVRVSINSRVRGP